MEERWATFDSETIVSQSETCAKHTLAIPPLLAAIVELPTSVFSLYWGPLAKQCNPKLWNSEGWFSNHQRQKPSITRPELSQNHPKNQPTHASAVRFLQRAPPTTNLKFGGGAPPMGILQCDSRRMIHKSHPKPIPDWYKNCATMGLRAWRLRLYFYFMFARSSARPYVRACVRESVRSSARIFVRAAVPCLFVNSLFEYWFAW